MTGAVHLRVRVALAIAEGTHRSRVITTRRFHFAHVGTQVAEHLRGVGPASTRVRSSTLVPESGNEVEGSASPVTT